MFGYIYILKCPIDGLVKYVGLTKSPKKRKSQHRCYSEKMSKNSRYNSWKLKLMSFNERPIFEIIEETQIYNLSEREIYWISFYKQNFDIFNLTIGGEFNQISENHNSKFLKGKKLEDYYGLEKAKEIKSKQGRKGDENSNYGGKNCTDVWKLNQSIAQSKKPLLVYENDILLGEFLNSKEVAKFLNYSHSSVRMSKSNNWLVKRKYKIIDKV